MATFRYDGETSQVDPTIGRGATLAICYACCGVKKVLYPPDQEAGFQVGDEVVVTDAEMLAEIRKDDRFTEL